MERDAMNADPSEPDRQPEENLPPEWLEALRTLPSERCRLSAETEVAIAAIAGERLAVIRRGAWRRCWRPALAAAACVVGFLVLFNRPDPEPKVTTVKPEDEYALILREVSAVFPRQVKAIVAGGPELEIDLADQPLSGPKQAVVVEVCEEKGCKTVITYVGQTFEIGSHRLTVRADESGAIIVDSPEFDGTAGSPEHPAPGLFINTRRI
ncbi:hypothetical protein [Haloferula sp. A504]|uniref:hypothetical protein n=1 Tax=Haloferula sp. A504 TaxID=3373601 RepID=UPI0031BD12A4|nr:hypothetical protein [Verrucomicrobiaceae bacterium E54]